MKLVQLTARNFMPFKDPVTVNFPTDDYRNVMLVLGDNMRGKTSLLNAIRWGFYESAVGRHSRVIGLHEIVNRDAAREGDWTVEVHITLEANGYKYDLRRVASVKSHVGVPSRTEDFTVAVHLTRDGVVISGDQVRPEIEEFAPEQISRFFLFDGELLQQYEELLIEGSEQGAQIKRSIEQVLGVPALLNGRDQIGAILKVATKKQNEEITLIQGLEKQAEHQRVLTARQDSYEKDYKRLSDRLAEVREERGQYEDELDAAAAVLSYKAQLDAVKSNYASQQEIRTRRHQDRVEVLANAWLDLLASKADIKREQLVGRQASLTASIKEQGRLSSKVDDLRSLLATKACPLCGQQMNEDHSAHLGAELGSLQGELARVVDDTNEMQIVAAQISSLTKIRGVSAKEQLVAIDRDVRSADVKSQRAENERERLEEFISGHDTAELARKRSYHIELVREEGKLASDMSQLSREIDKTKDELAIAQRTIQSMATARAQRSTRKVAVAADLERIFSASIERLRDRLRTEVSVRANEAFGRLTTQKTYGGLEINKNYGLSILDGAGRRVTLRSAGAEQIVALSLIDGLNRTGRSAGPVVMDTPFGRLDLKHRDNILAYLPTVTSQFVLLVHSGEIRPATDLAVIKPRVGVAYTIEEISSSQSRIVRTQL